jgi:hypothetical protein
VKSVRLPKPTVLHCLTFTLFLVGFPMLAHAGIRGPGKYCGVVVFDRWDACFLLNGPYITYISENVKNELRPYEGKAKQFDASSVFQPENPGAITIRFGTKQMSSSSHQAIFGGRSQRDSKHQRSL